MRSGAPVFREYRRARGSQQVNLIDADLSGENLWDFDFSGVDFTGARLVETSFVGPWAYGTSLKGARLVRANLYGSHLATLNLERANLRDADLRSASCWETDFSHCILDGTKLIHADLTGAWLEGASLQGANLEGARLRNCELVGANFRGARMKDTILASETFADAIGVADVIHGGPSVFDARMSGVVDRLPLNFLTGVGLGDEVITGLSGIARPAAPSPSCFISYSAKDRAFVDRLHEELQAANIRCWRDSEDLKIGDDILDSITQAIRSAERVVIVLSNNSVASRWVNDEVNAALERERRGGRTVLFPVTLDDAVMESQRGWAGILRTRHIADFRGWDTPSAYQRSLDRVIRDLKTQPSL